MTTVARVLEELNLNPGPERGERIRACCPYHQEKTPSWIIRARDPGRGLHYCFGCHRGGGLVGLVMHVLGLAREDAVLWLQGELPDAPTALEPWELVGARVEVLPLGGDQTPRFALPPEVHVEPLPAWPSPPRRYVEQRGITSDQVERWGIAHAVGGRLDGRIVLVVRDRLSRPASYMARAYAGQPKRYLYPRGEEHPDLTVLFGEERWPPPVPGMRSEVWVAEGALNALALERCLLRLSRPASVAALGGSQVQAQAVGKLASFARVVIATDADLAGERAADELEQQLARHVEVRRLRFPEHVDAADLDQQDPRALDRMATEAAAPA